MTFDHTGWEQLVQNAVAARHARIEQALEAALQTGEYGVLVDELDGTVEVSPHVPYGQVYLCPNGRPPDWR